MSMRNHQDTVKQDKQRDKICDIVQILHHLHHVCSMASARRSLIVLDVLLCGRLKIQSRANTAFGRELYLSRRSEL